MVDPGLLVVNSLTLGALYALIAIGFTMIFGVADILNIAHGAAIIIGGFSAYYVYSSLGLSIWVGVLAAVVLPALFSVAVYKLLVKRVEDDEIFVVIVTLVVLLIVEYFFRFIEGTTSRSLPLLLPGQTTIGSVSVQNNSILLFVISWIAIIALFLLINRTWIGRGIEGLSMTERGASLVGIDHERTTIYTYAIAGALAGLGGLFFGITQGVQYDMGLDPLLTAFAIVILGGMGSIKGSVIGAYIIGTLETVTITMISPRMTGMTALIVLFLILIVRPNGLLGRPGEE